MPVGPNRRALVAGLGSAAAWPLVARAEQSPLPVIGFLNSLSSDWPFVPAFRDGLQEMGYVEGQNVAIEYRWAEGHYDRLPELAADLVRRHVAVIAATGGDPSALAAKATTTTVPIVFNVAEDPVRAGLVTSLNRPGGNMTGVSMLTIAMDAKRLELLHDAIPGPAVVAALANPNFSEAEAESRLLNVAARALNRQIQILNVSNDRDLDIAFDFLVQQHAGALFVVSDPFLFTRREKLVALAARYAIPAIYFVREFVVAGGLMSYGANFADLYHQLGVYTGRILKGEKAGDLPIVQPTKFEFVINLKTARTLGLEVSPSLLARADEVIE
jgi:putative tryptophan/tyrosine transport system substrate-binding protein